MPDYVISPGDLKTIPKPSASEGNTMPDSERKPPPETDEQPDEHALFLPSGERKPPPGMTWGAGLQLVKKDEHAPVHLGRRETKNGERKPRQHASQRRVLLKGTDEQPDKHARARLNRQQKCVVCKKEARDNNPGRTLKTLRTIMKGTIFGCADCNQAVCEEHWDEYTHRPSDYVLIPIPKKLKEYHYGLENFPTECRKCGKTRKKHPFRFPAMTPEELGQAPKRVKARAEGCGGIVYKGDYCAPCRLSAKAEGKAQSDARKEQRNKKVQDEKNGIRRCMYHACDKVNPKFGITDQGTESVYCEDCYQKLSTQQKTRGKRVMELETADMDPEKEQYCTRGQHKVPKENFHRCYVINHGKKVLWQDGCKFKICRDCAYEDSKACVDRKHKVKLEMSEEKLLKLKEYQSVMEHNGCSKHCCVNIVGYQKFCESRTEHGCGPEENFVIRKKALPLDYHHVDPSKKVNNVSQIKSRTKRHNEIKGPPGCILLCVACHKEETYMRCDTYGKPTLNNRNEIENLQPVSKLRELLLRLKFELWKKQGCKCDRPDCPMGESLKKGLEKMKANKESFNTLYTAEQLFLMFYMEFEHREAFMKSFNLAGWELSSQKFDEELIKEIIKEANKCRIYCVFCARLKTWECGDSVTKRLAEKHEMLAILDDDDVEFEVDEEIERLMFVV